MTRLYLEVIGENEDVKDVIAVCKSHYGRCMSRRLTSCEHIVAVDVDNFIQKWRIKRDINMFRKYMDQADVRVVNFTGV